MRKARLELRSIDPTLVAAKHTDYASFISLFAPAFPDAGELISLGNRYTVSLGAHSTHAILLMDKSGSVPLTIQTVFSLCSLLAYVTDSPVVPMPLSNVSRPPNDAGWSSLHLIGTSIRSLDDYLEIVTAVAGISQRLLDIDSHVPYEFWAEREFPIGAWDEDKWVYISLPDRMEVWRALAAYSSGMLGVLAPGRLLNYWRALEAMTTRQQRDALFADLPALNARPVWSRSHPRKIGRRYFFRFNATARLRRRALHHWHDICGQYGSAPAALKHLHSDKRGKAAHADKQALEYEGLSTLAEQHRDAELLRYCARVAIDQAW
jgi:hypothetical protein